MKEKTFVMKMDSKLHEQLKRYSQSKDQSLAQSARQALSQFLEEEKNVKE